MAIVKSPCGVVNVQHGRIIISNSRLRYVDRSNPLTAARQPVKPLLVNITKAEFSRQCGVSRARVTQWVRERKIDGAALVGEGTAARIDPAIAVHQLRERLDVNQRFGKNGLNTRLDGAATGQKTTGRDDRPQPSAISETVEAQIKAQKLRQVQLMTSRLEEEDRRRRGVYIEAAGARGEMSRLASELLSAVEGALPDLASDLSAKFEISAREAVHCLRAGFRRFRERTAARYAAVAAGAPRTKPTGEDEPGGIQ